MADHWVGRLADFAQEFAHNRRDQIRIGCDRDQLGGTHSYPVVNRKKCIHAPYAGKGQKTRGKNL